jgi:hypothetical protein
MPSFVSGSSVARRATSSRTQSTAFPRRFSFLIGLSRIQSWVPYEFGPERPFDHASARRSGISVDEASKAIIANDRARPRPIRLTFAITSASLSVLSLSFYRNERREGIRNQGR